MRRGQAKPPKITKDEEKFKVGSDPLEVEHTLKEMIPHASDQHEDMLNMVDFMLKDRQYSFSTAERNALEIWKANLTASKIEPLVKRQFVVDFWSWLLGRGRPEDHAKTPWGRQTMTGDNEVATYVEMFVKKQHEFKVKLKLLGARAPVGIKQSFLYFKYIVRGESLNGFLKDWDVFCSEFDEARSVAMGPKRQYYEDSGARGIEMAPYGDVRREFSEKRYSDEHHQRPDLPHYQGGPPPPPPGSGVPPPPPNAPEPPPPSQQPPDTGTDPAVNPPDDDSSDHKGGGGNDDDNDDNDDGDGDEFHKDEDEEKKRKEEEKRETDQRIASLRGFITNYQQMRNDLQVKFEDVKIEANDKGKEEEMQVAPNSPPPSPPPDAVATEEAEVLLANVPPIPIGNLRERVFIDEILRENRQLHNDLHEANVKQQHKGDLVRKLSQQIDIYKAQWDTKVKELEEIVENNKKIAYEDATNEIEAAKEAANVARAELDAVMAYNNRMVAEVGDARKQAEDAQRRLQELSQQSMDIMNNLHKELADSRAELTQNTSESGAKLQNVIDRLYRAEERLARKENEYSTLRDRVDRETAGDAQQMTPEMIEAVREETKKEYQIAMDDMRDQLEFNKQRAANAEKQLIDMERKGKVDRSVIDAFTEELQEAIEHAKMTEEMMARFQLEINRLTNQADTTRMHLLAAEAERDMAIFNLRKEIEAKEVNTQTTNQIKKTAEKKQKRDRANIRANIAPEKVRASVKADMELYSEVIVNTPMPATNGPELNNAAERVAEFNRLKRVSEVHAEALGENVVYKRAATVDEAILQGDPDMAAAELQSIRQERRHATDSIDHEAARLAMEEAARDHAIAVAEHDRLMEQQFLEDRQEELLRQQQELAKKAEKAKRLKKILKEEKEYSRWQQKQKQRENPRRNPDRKDRPEPGDFVNMPTVERKGKGTDVSDMSAVTNSPAGGGGGVGAPSEPASGYSKSEKDEEHKRPLTHDTESAAKVLDEVRGRIAYLEDQAKSAPEENRYAEEIKQAREEEAHWEAVLTSRVAFTEPEDEPDSKKHKDRVKKDK